MSILINVIGWLAVAIGAAMYAPQTFKIIKTKDSKGLSVVTFSLAAFGNGMWLLYTSSLGDFTNTCSGWAVNIIIEILMLPIVFFIFRDKPYHRYIIYLWFIATTAISLWWNLAFDKNTIPGYVSIILVCFAGGVTSFGFVPQIIKILKTKTVGNLSLLLVLLYGIVNGLWTIYWTLNIVHDSSSDKVPSEMISAILDAIGFFVQFFLGFLVVKYRKKAKQ